MGVVCCDDTFPNWSYHNGETHRNIYTGQKRFQSNGEDEEQTMNEMEQRKMALYGTACDRDAIVIGVVIDCFRLFRPFL